MGKRWTPSFLSFRIKQGGLQLIMCAKEAFVSCNLQRQKKKKCTDVSVNGTLCVASATWKKQNGVVGLCKQKDCCVTLFVKMDVCAHPSVHTFYLGVAFNFYKFPLLVIFFFLCFLVQPPHICFLGGPVEGI